MVDVGEGVWGPAWDQLYESLGGNPWAAMPSLHFATSLMAALLLAEIGPVPGAVGAGYAAALGFALVYLGEHYVTDLLAGAALVALVRRGEPARRARGRGGQPGAAPARGARRVAGRDREHRPICHDSRGCLVQA